MAKEILIYGDIDTYSAAQFLKDMEAAAGEDVTVRIFTNGGDPEASFGMIAKFIEHTGKKNTKIDGSAYSAGTFFPCYSDNVECLDVSQFLFHRAAFPSWFESSDRMTEAMWENLDNVNKSLRKAAENKIDVKLLKQLKGVTMDQIFSNETRLDVFLTAKEAKKIGLVDTVIPITPKKKTEISTYLSEAEKSGKIKMAAKYELPNPTTTMTTLDELKAQFPDIYKAALALGAKEEKSRVNAWLAFNEIDAEAVTKGVAGGEPVTMQVIAEMTAKGMSKERLAKLASDNPNAVSTQAQEETEKTAKEENLVAFRKKALGSAQLVTELTTSK